MARAVARRCPRGKGGGGCWRARRGGGGARSGRGAALQRARARRCYSGWRQPLQEGPLPALPAPSLARADADVGAGSWREAPISAGRLRGAGAPRYLPSGAGAWASRAGCMLQRETPGSQGDWGRQAKAASAALWGRRVTGGVTSSATDSGAGGASSPFPPADPPSGLDVWRMRAPWERASVPGKREGSPESTCSHTQAASPQVPGLPFSAGGPTRPVWAPLDRDLCLWLTCCLVHLQRYLTFAFAVPPLLVFGRGGQEPMGTYIFFL